MRLTGQDDGDGGGGRDGRSGSSARSSSGAPLVLALSVAPASTAVALFRGGDALRAESLAHAARDGKLEAQRDARARAVSAFLQGAAIAPGGLAAVAVHAAAPRPVAPGTYRIDAALLNDAGRQRAAGASLAAMVAHAVAEEWGCPAFAVDLAGRAECDAPESVESSVCERALLAMKAAARRHALAVDRSPESLRLVLVHLGAAVSLCVQVAGRVGDVHHTFGPDSTAADLQRALERAEAGDGHAAAVLHGAANRIAQVVGALATVLEGEVDAVLVTGTLERAGAVLAEICRRVEWIAPVFLYRDQDELLALAQGARAVLGGGEPLKHYG